MTMTGPQAEPRGSHTTGLRPSAAGLACLFVLLSLMLFPACKRFSKAGADREVYGILKGKRDGVPELAGTLDIEAQKELAEAIRTREAFELDLRKTLALATTAAREYRQQRENVFLTALSLTQEMNRFRPLWGAGGTPTLNFTRDGVIVDGSTGIGLSRALANGGTVVFGLASQFTRVFAGDPLRVAQSILDADVVLPLMRGSGNLVAQEGLRQAERDTCYALRDYALFQQDFTVDITTRFYRALQQRDRWGNAEARYKSFQLLQEELSAKAVSGRIPRFEVDQSEQRLLESDDARQRARNNFETAVDQLKLDIGIPVHVDVVLKKDDLQALRAEGPRALEFAEPEALQVASQTRLDLRTSRDEEIDAERHTRVAKDALRAGLDLVLGGDLGSTRQNPLDFNGRNLEGRVGLDIDLPLERTTERNAYRRTIITMERATRNRERLEDTITFEVRDSFRTLAQAKRSYDIQVLSEKLAARRVESTQLLLEQGKASTRDRLDAEDDLALARNAVTGAIVDHFLARLALLRDIGKLRVDAEGSWNEEAGTVGSATQAAFPPAPPPESQPAPPVHASAYSAAAGSSLESGASPQAEKARQAQKGGPKAAIPDLGLPPAGQVPKRSDSLGG